MTSPHVEPDTDIRTRVQTKEIKRVPDQDGTFIAPSMAHDTRIGINTALPDNPLLRRGKRYNWPEESQP